MPCSKDSSRHAAVRHAAELSAQDLKILATQLPKHDIHLFVRRPARLERKTLRIHCPPS